MDTTRLSPAPDVPATFSITDLLEDHHERTPAAELYRVPDGAGWRSVSVAEFRDQAIALARGLLAQGVVPGERVGIMSRTRYEWTLADVAIWYAGAVPVPVYETSSVSQAAWILSDSGAVAVIVETPAHAEVVEAARAEAPDLRVVWQIDAGDLATVTASGTDVDPERVRDASAAVGLADLATIIYTSGTTGRPKGAELTHGNFVLLARSAVEDLSEIVHQEGASTLLFMPLAHVFARFVEILALAGRIPLGHTPDPSGIVTDLGTYRPTLILAVPRVFEKVYNSAEQKAIAGGKGKIFAWAAGTAGAWSRAQDDGGRPGALLNLRYRLAHKLVLSKIQSVMGGRLTYAVSGGGPLGERLGHFFRGVGLTVLEGYGLTETTAPLSVNVPSKVKIGTVGPPLRGNQLRIAPDGEILARGVAVFRGYHNNEAATAEAVVDGWFHTGDLGELDADGYARITGRKKEIIVTAGGKNVAPAQLEDAIRAHPLVSQCLVVGEGRPFIAALVTIDSEMLPGWLAAQGKDEMTLAQAVTDPDVRAAVGSAVDRANSHVSRAESIREFRILETDFTIANDYLTPSMKVKRSAVLRDLAGTLEELYRDAAASRS
ncbi:AMP-dependent synthetase/ligase [Litorihabitans aurantiacus]|uniref:Acyl-CoA synthetase n=1 Tax=Litorihabitans aurantiacus TaxID=1930061 RepID=A0AA38CSB3_9MICO|nr:long-chain fatty acid--CoA ligase [Litorihabitans aurantiacus]GMA31479.1 long-chain-fatty-acid--CoA ligase [Litorihabitans aurantiacus]